MKKNTGLTLLLGLGLCFLPISAPAQSKKVLDKSTFYDMESVTGPAISPDGKQVVFTRTFTDKLKDQYRSSLWIAATDGTRTRELTGDTYSARNPVWSPDGTRIAFIADRDGTNQLHVLYIDKGEIAQLTHLEREPADLHWSPDGKRILFSTLVPDTDSALPIKLPELPKGAQPAKTATVIDRMSWAADGQGPVIKAKRQVFLVDAVLGGTAQRLTDGKYSYDNPEWSPDGTKVYVSCIPKDDPEFERGNSEIFVVMVATGGMAPLTDRVGPDTNPTPSPDGKRIAYTGYDYKKFTFHLSSIYLMDVDGTNKKLWVGNLPSSPSNLLWAKDGSGVYYTMEERGSSNIWFAPLTGAPTNLTEFLSGNRDSGVVQIITMVPGVIPSGKGKKNPPTPKTAQPESKPAPSTPAVREEPSRKTLTGFDVSNSGQAVAVWSTFKEPGKLVTFSVKDARVFTELVDVNADVLTGMTLGDAEELNFTAPDGGKAQGWLIKPANYEPGKKYPLVLWIHGGPWSMYNVGFNWAFQNFSAEGYAVLYTNPRGSTGYGQDFVNGIQYSYPGKDYDDLMAGVDAAISKGFIDEKNLFVCGGSGGGVLTAWIVGHTDRFAGAVSMRPVIDWHSFVGTTDGPVTWYDQFRKYPWEDPQEFAARSPLTYVANIRTPTMVMTGEADLRTPISQTEEFYRALKMLKKETLMVRMPDEFHGWRRPTHQLAQQLYLQAWFERHKRK